jgi:hypothetical protein
LTADQFFQLKTRVAGHSFLPFIDDEYVRSGTAKDVNIGRDDGGVNTPW